MGNAEYMGTQLNSLSGSLPCAVRWMSLTVSSRVKPVWVKWSIKRTPLVSPSQPSRIRMRLNSSAFRVLADLCTRKPTLSGVAKRWEPRPKANCASVLRLGPLPHVDNFYEDLLYFLKTVLA